MKATPVIVKINVNKNERKEIISITDPVNYVVVEGGIFKVFNVGYIENLKLLDDDNNIECFIEDKFISILRDKIDYIDFKKEYKKQGKIVFKIKLKHKLSKIEEEEINSHF